MTPAPLEASVTLDEVLAVVATRRVPLAPELAGYVALELAEAPAARDRGVQPHNVFIGEDGTVAIVRTKGDRDDGAEPDTETSIRSLLGKLLEASGSQTPALAAVARKMPDAGTAALARELEAALIPVNRSAGRRALARLAREVKRVTLNVGRNAMRSGPNEAPAPAPIPAPGPAPDRPAPAAAPKEKVEPQEAPSEPAPIEPAKVATGPTPAGDGGRGPSAALPDAGASADLAKPALGESGPDAVDGLVARFEVSGERGDKALSAELKKMVGLEPTPPPPSPTTTGDEDGAHALLGSATAPAPAADASRESRSLHADERQRQTAPSMRRSPAAQTQRSRRSTIWRVVVLVVGLAAVLWFLWTLK